MKIKIGIIIGLSLLLIVLSALTFARVGSSASKSLEEEEMEAFQSRKVYKNLSTDSERASYALGMTQQSETKFLDNKDTKYLSLFYNVVSNPSDTYYYGGQTATPPLPLNLRSWIPAIDMPLDEECFVAGVVQTVENKVRIPSLAGTKGKDYIFRIMNGKP